MVSGATEAQRVVRFGPFEANLHSGELRKRGIRVRLGGQPKEILAALLEHPGEIVTREELRRRLWKDNTFVEFETGLNSAVKKLRIALGDSADNPLYVETLPRVGYRFAAQVATEKPELTTPKSDVPAAAPRKAASWYLPLVAACVVVVTLVAIAYQWRRSRARAAASSRISVAVLPFENLTGDPAQEYFSDGLTEEMIAQLGRADTQHLGVIGRTSVMRYKNTQESLDQIGRELGVGYILEGGVQRAGDRVRITAVLIQAKDQTHVWTHQFDRQVTDLLVLQGEITQEIADEIELTLAENKPVVRAKQPPLSPAEYEAYDLYLRGRYYWNKRSPQGFTQAAAYFQQAVDKDPADGRAYAGLADTYAMMGDYSFVAANDIMPKARAAALKAVQLDDSLAEAHTSLAIIAENYNWYGPTAEKEFRRAIQLDPNYATAHHWYAEFLALQGRFDEAFAESERARQLDPLSLIIAADNAAIFYFSRQYDEAIQRFRAVLQMDPTVVRAHLVIAAYAQKGQFQEALADAESWRRTDDGPGRLAWEAYAYGRTGETARAQQLLREIQMLSRQQQLDPAQFLNVAYAGMGDRQIWLSWLEKVCSDRTNIPIGFKVDPIYDPIRNDPRFQKMLAQVRFTQ